MELCDGTLSELSALSNAATEASLVSGVPVPAGVKIFDEAAVIEVLTHVCRALRYAHARNVAHLDVKPDNVLHRRGAYKLADWGRAAPVDGIGWTKGGGKGDGGDCAARCRWFPPVSSPCQGLGGVASPLESVQSAPAAVRVAVSIVLRTTHRADAEDGHRRRRRWHGRAL